jgi:Leucine-rich repeat (LRR) protein
MEHASGNGLKSISDGFLRNATSVERIDLSLNNLGSFSSAVFTKLRKLKQLDLQGNIFTDTTDILTIFNNTRQLVSLNLSLNNIGNIINGTFQALTDLRILNLSRNNMSVTHADTFKGLESLKALFLHHNNIDEINNTTLTPLNSLETLDLSDCSYGIVRQIYMRYCFR